MAKTLEIKPEEQAARSYADRLILRQLTEMESAIKLGDLAERLSGDGIGLAALKSLLASNPDRFAYHERRWIPASRLAGQGRPFQEAALLVLRNFGGPMPVQLLAEEVARIRQADPIGIEDKIYRMIDLDHRFVDLADDKVALLEWSFVATDETIERALALNRVSREEADAVAAKIGSIDWLAPGSVAQALKKATPVSLKALGAAAYVTLYPKSSSEPITFDAVALARAAFEAQGYVFGADGSLHVEADAKKWISVATKVADRLSATVEMEDAQPIDIKPEDVDKMAAKIAAAGGTTTAMRLLEENYEITPANKTFPDDLANLLAALKGNGKLQWVGGDRFRKAGDVPEDVAEVPEPFQFIPSGVLDEEGEDVDVELTDDGLSTSLRKLLSHPLALDVLDEEPQPAPKSLPETVRLVLKSIHRELGTFPLAQLPTGWLDAQPATQELIFRDSQGRELEVWMNNESRLMVNLFDWWFEQPIESGAVFTLTKTLRPNVFDFAWMDQPDPVIFIPTQRMEELRQMGVESDGKSTLQILCDVMTHWNKGADYLTILAEVNVVRRSSRRLIASLLSSYQCFYQRSGSPVWHYDPKKLELGFDKSKKRFIKK